VTPPAAEVVPANAEPETKAEEAAAPTEPVITKEEEKPEEEAAIVTAEASTEISEKSQP
jgi:hypothetical protein